MRFYKSKSKNATMITGAIFGISHMIQDALGIESRPKSINYEDRTLLFTYREDIAFILISDRYSKILHNGLENFADLFIHRFSKEIENWKGSVKSFDEANNLIIRSFPFIEVEK
jgi:hypothetical protein